MNMFDSLKSIQSQLFDAPDSIKSEFNTLVKYFDVDYKDLDNELKSLIKQYGLSKVKVALDIIETNGEEYHDELDFDFSPSDKSYIKRIWNLIKTKKNSEGDPCRIIKLEEAPYSKKYKAPKSKVELNRIVKNFKDNVVKEDSHSSLIIRLLW